MSVRPFLGTEHADLSARKPYDIIDEPIAEDYWGLIDGSLSQCDTGILVVKEDALSEQGRAVVDDLRRFATAEIPGGVLGIVLRFELNIQSAAIVKSVAPGLYSWVNPDLPEDLCLFRRDGTPWLVTVSRERLGHVELTAFEKLLLARMGPGLGGALAHQAARDAILAVFERRFEAAQEPLVDAMVAHASSFLSEAREGIVDALGEWLESSDPTRVTVALSAIGRLGLDEFFDEIAEMEVATREGKVVIPAVFRSNSVLRDRWQARHQRHLEQTLADLEKAAQHARP